MYAGFCRFGISNLFQPSQYSEINKKDKREKWNHPAKRFWWSKFRGKVFRNLRFKFKGKDAYLVELPMPQELVMDLQRLQR